MPDGGLVPCANTLAGTIQGSILGAWFDCGATPELLKEYMTRFVDLVWEKCEAVQKYGEAKPPPEPPDPPEKRSS